MKRVLFRVGSALHRTVYRLSGGRVWGKGAGVPVLLLTVPGRKSGKRRTLPLLYGEDGGRYVVVGSKGGDPKHPAWFLNLQAAGEADIQVGSKHLHVRAREAEGEERERLFAHMVELYPAYADYQTKTTRRIPVMVLEPAA